MAVTVTRAGGLIIGGLLRAEATMGGDGLLFEVSVGLYTAGPALTPIMQIGDFTPATFTGYAPLTAQTFGVAYLNTAGELQLTSPTLQWIATAVPAPETLIGYYVWREGTPDVLLFADNFSSGILIDEPGDGVAFVCNFVVNLLSHGGHTFIP